MVQRHGACSTMMIAGAWSHLPILLLMAVIDLGIASLGYEACAAEVSDCGIGSSLLQAARHHQAPPSLNQQETDETQMQQQPTPTVGKARSMLPPHLYALGLQLLQTEEVLDAFVATSVVADWPYGGVNMTLRMLNGCRVREDDTYGIDSLGQKGVNSNPADMMNMIDIGGNYGRVSIAAFKNYPTKMRIVVVEPLPSTFLLLKWNLWQNSVPELTLEELQASPTRPGVVALNNGIADVEGKTMDLCYDPPNTMSTRICNCTNGWAYQKTTQCHHMVSLTALSLLQSFGNAPINFLKLDCEGCEFDVIPALMTLTQTSGLRIDRFAGELHTMPNELEDFACKYEGGKWFVHICAEPKSYELRTLLDRCARGPGRASCSLKSLSEMKHLPPTEW